MQLKFKKICLLSTIFVYCASFLLQSNLGLFQTFAQWSSSNVNIVAILVDDKILGWISEDLQWYATEYIQGEKIFNSKALIIPLDVSNITAYDIYRMMENIYFDGLKDTPSTLVGLIMIWDIPLPVVNQNWYIFPTVYPYVDFEDQKYVWDPVSEYFVSNDNPSWQAEIWHWLINFWDDIDAYIDEKKWFFKKLKKYNESPKDFVWESMWYDDFIAQKKGFLDENFPYYRNRVMFAEDLWYQRYSPLMKKLFEWEQLESALDIASDLGDLDESLVSGVKESLGENHTTKMVQQEIDTSFVSDYNDLFSQLAFSTMRENIFAWSRRIKEHTNDKGEKSLIVDSDGSISKLQLKDDLLLWNENIQWLIENLNDLMENMIDKKIEENNLSMDIVVPVSYKEVTKKKVSFKCWSFVNRYENYYFGSNSQFIDNAEDFSIYRWTYRNLSSISWVTYDSLLLWKNQIKSDYDKTNLKLKSIWWSYDIFSMQVEWNRWYNMFNIDGDLDTYEENKTQKNRSTSHKGLFGRVKKRTWPEFCDDESKKHQCENLFDFAMRWWWWASPINLDWDSVLKWRYELSGYLATDSWRPIYGMNWFQSVIVGDDEWSSWTGWKDWKWKGPQWDATNYNAYLKYASPTQREWWWKSRVLWLWIWYEIYENHTPDVHMDLEKMSYWNLTGDAIEKVIAQLNLEENGFIWLSSIWSFSRISDKIFSITKKLWWCGWWWSSGYIYKVISSVVKHTSTTEDQINWIDRDKYWETWTLWKYYYDVKAEYDDLSDTMSGGIEAFSWLIASVNSWNDYLSGKFNSLKALLSNAGASTVPNTELQDKLSELESQLAESQESLSWLKLELENLEQLREWNENETDVDEVTDEEDVEDETFESDGVSEDDNHDVYEAEINEISEKIIELEQNISDLEQQIEVIKVQMTAWWWTFQTALDEISEYIKRENAQLTNAYELIMSLYTDNIIWVLEFIAYLEWWQPEDYYEPDSQNLVRIWFLPSWIENLNNMILEIRENETMIISGYEEVYSLIQVQQEKWFELAEELKEVNENYSEAIDKVSEEMEQIFTIVDDGKDYDEDGNEIVKEDGEEDDEEDDEEVQEPIVLSWSTAVDAMEAFDQELTVLSWFFFNLVKEDDAWPAIVEAAKGDTDFLLWLYKEETWKSKPTGALEIAEFYAWFQYWLRVFVANNTFTETDWINKYAQWTKGPWYDSEWARRNHDLLLWVSDHMSWMNLLTPDRPIDSPRYVSMQSVAWREMKFIYPDLFKVEVYQLSWKNISWYDINLLLTWWQIKKNLIKYLTWKVDEYNKILQEECDEALDMNIHFNGLQKMSYMSATPDKAFHSCGTGVFTYEDFLEVLWWEKMLDTLSEVLYYQSVTNKRKLSDWNVEKDLEFIKDSFSLNAKRKWILEDYLVEWNEEIKNLIFEIPTYEKSGYEVGYINSNWKDYIFPSEKVNEKTSDYGFTADAVIVKNEADLFDTKRRQPSGLENENDDECNIPIDWKLMLLTPWLQWFHCRLKKVKEEPFKLKLTFDDSLGEVMSAKSFNDIVRSLDLDESFIDRKDSWSNYADEWNEILNKDETNDFDARITQMQVDADKHNQEVSNWGDWVANLLSSLDKDIRIENSNSLLSDTSPTSNLKIASMSEIWNITVTFEWTWDWCLNINWIDLCDGKTFTKSFNPKKNPFTWLITSSSGHVAWKVGLIMKIWIEGWYMEKIIKYTISPSVPTKVSLKVKSDGSKKQVIVVDGMTLPINATLYDDYDNVVPWWTEKYKFTVTPWWRFLKDWWYMNNFYTNDFRDLNFYYEVPEDFEGEVDIQILTSKDEVIWTLPINVIKATLETRIDKTLIDKKENICHRLWYWNPTCNACVWPCGCYDSSCPPVWCPKNSKIILSKNAFENIYDWWKLDVSQLHKIDLDLKDKNWKLINIDSQVIVTSKKWLLVLGQVNKQDDWDDIFLETSKFYMTWWHVELYYYLTTVAGSDVLNIDVPSIISRTIDFQIQEHTCTTSSVKLRNWYVEVWVPDFIEFFNADIFWNVLGWWWWSCYDQTKVDFPKTQMKGPNCLCGWNEEANECNYSFSDGRDKIDIVWVWGGITEVAGLQFEVSESLIPDSWLNILYLNYFGNDRWNQWWYRSNNNKRVESMMKKSKKLITTTTQLISEDKIKKLVWRIDPWFKIVNIDGLDTVVTMSNGGMYLSPNWELSNGFNVWVWFSNDSVKNLGSIQDIYSWILDSKRASSTYLFYIPSEPEYKLLNKFDLYDGSEKIWNLYSSGVVLKLTSQVLSNGDNVWNLMYNWVSYWNIVIHAPDANIWWAEGVFNIRYSIGPVFTKWTTNNMSSIWVFDEFSDFELNTNYKSIQDSDDIDEKVWFVWDFKNITLFWEGQSVGEATKKFWSELLINLWDPVLSLKKDDLNENAYGMNYDGWVWREVFEDSENNIFWTYIIDFDGNWIDDLLVAYADWTFKLAKNYAGEADKYDMKNLQELMRLAVPIKDVFVWGKKDIFVYTQNNQLRAYLNDGWTFDVDGKLVCLNQNVYGWERSSTPSNLEWLNQFFIEDMDKDGVSDIITYDAKWYIKVFYGPWYLSTDKYSCDRWWYDRQKNNVTEVAAFGVNVGWEALDDSMMYRVWLTGSDVEIDDPSEFWINIDVDNLDKLIKPRDRNSDGSIEEATKEIMDIDHFNVDDASKKFVEKESIYVDVTIYGDPLVWWLPDQKNYVFVPLRYLDDAWSPCKVSKTYHPQTSKWILEDGDIVTVSVNIGPGCVGAYWDLVKWPWNIYYNKDGTVKSFRFLWGTGSAILRGRDWNFAYIVDNIHWQTSFEYDLEYQHVPLKKMSITYETYWSDDEFPDIKLQSVDWCIKDFIWYVNLNGSRKFQSKNIPLQEMIDKEYLEEDDQTEDFPEEIFDAWSDANKLPWIVWDSISRVKLLQSSISTQEISDDEGWREQLKDVLLQWLMNGSIVVDLSVFGEEMEKIDAIVDDLMKWMCNWFSFWWANNCKWLPVPFNQAFLAPGKYHLFGCWDLPMGKLEDWIPAFFFPGNLWPVFWAYLPIPYAPAWPLDDFLRVKNPAWPYSSFIRIYAAPTLTAQLWIAICMWSYKTAKLSFPSPIWDIAWNCVVFAVKPQCKNEGKYPDRKKDKNNPNEVYTWFTEDVKNSGVCMSDSSVSKWSKDSPYGLYDYSTEIHVEDPCTTSCTMFDPSKPKCWNWVKDKGEDCSNCFIDLRSECQNCGNSIVEKDLGEECDYGLLNGHTSRCTFDCKIGKWGRCGNGVVDSTGEVCDLWDLNGQFWEKNSIYGKSIWVNTRESIWWGDGSVLENMVNNADVEWWQNYSVDFSANYLWMIDFDMSSTVWYDYETNTKNSIFIWDVDVLWWDYKKNKIKWWIQQWIRKFLIDNWLDPQIRYIANQLTKMHINIKLPDMWAYINNEVQTVKDLTDGFWDIWENDEKFDNKVDTWWGSLTDWSYINYDNLKSINKTISNPFESLASILNESNIINISVEPITVKVPWIFAEDINSYELYLKQWLAVNQDIINQWSGVLNSFGTKCASLDDEQEKEKCYETAEKNLASFVEFEGWDWKRLQNQIYANLQILQQYRNFPFEVYEWIHSIERYMSEIASLISSTIWYLSYWTTVNAERFVWYVDAIILIINIIKTYQIIPDFSLEWSQKCGSCARDTYDQYACKLSFLCDFQLPIIQIPNFKLPNITLDLSDIDLSLDIILPSFNFQPLKVSLPDLPNLPTPPTVSVDIKLFDLPNIPLLPEPPELPELPSFIPEIDIELPILPPAPEIPKIPASIEATLNIVKMFWKLYCIIKWKFWLVWESSVKAKIEQLTQRTYEVSWIDNIKDFTNRTVGPIHNYWLDYEISSHVDMKFDFSVFYDLLDMYTKNINDITTSTVDWANRKLDSAVYNDITKEYIINPMEAVDWANLDFSLDLTKADSSFNNFDVMWLASDEIEYTDYDTAKSRLEDVLTYFKAVVGETTFKDSLNPSIDKVKNQISKENVVKPNIEWLEKVENDVIDYLNTEKSNYDKLADLVNTDYDWFLAMIDSQDKSEFGSWRLLTFNAKLFDVDASTRDNIDMIVKENPYEVLLDNKKEIIDWYWNAINSNTANDLWVTKSQYLVMREGIWKLKNQITSLYSLTKPVSSTKLVAKNWNVDTNKTLLSVADSQLKLWSNPDVANVIDPSVLSNGIYDKIIYWADAWKLGKIVYSDSFASAIWDNYTKILRDGYHDWLLWDNKSAYIKCKDQKCFSEWWFGGYYITSSLSEVPYEEKYIRFSDGTVLKIADTNNEVKNWEVVGQSYDTLSFSWKLEDVDGYLIDLMDRIDYNYEKKYSHLRPIYVLALPKTWPSLDELYANWTKLELIGDDDKDFRKIEKLYWTWKELVQVVYYDSGEDLANIILSNVDRKWYYARIATLNLNWDAYEISSPWSNQVVAWKQILWDENGPEWDPVLYRPSIKQNVSQWNDLNGYVWTRYNLVVNWKDDVALSYINLSKDWVLLDERYTSESEDAVSTQIDIHTKWGEREVYNSVWIDQFGNKTQKVITVSYSIPEISITDISKNDDWKTALIKAELSQDIDQWNVSFQRRRWSVWKTMRTNDNTDPDISLAPWKKLVAWSYSAGNDVAMYDKNENVIALMDPDTAEIKIQSWYVDKYGIRVVVEDSLVLQIFDKEDKNQNSVFSIYIPVEDCSNIDEGNYKKKDLPKSWNMGMFNGWKAIYNKDWDSILLVSPTCHLYSELWLRWTYRYDIWSKSLELTLYQFSDSKKNNPIKLFIKAKPLTLN